MDISKRVKERKCERMVQPRDVVYFIAILVLGVVIGWTFGIMDFVVLIWNGLGAAVVIFETYIRKRR